MDVETTGISPRNDRIVEIAIVRLGPGTAPFPTCGILCDLSDSGPRRPAPDARALPEHHRRF